MAELKVILLTGAFCCPILGRLAQPHMLHTHRAKTEAQNVGIRRCLHNCTACCRGYVLNTRTGKVINMELSTYTKLVSEGYQLDRVQGTLTPPSKADASQRHLHSSQEPAPSGQQHSGQTGPDSARRRSHRSNH